MKCYACGKLVSRPLTTATITEGSGLCSLSFQGHISRDCTAPNGGPLSSAGKVCYKCAQAGHISRDCPNNEASAQQAAEPVAAAAPVPTAAAPAPAAVDVSAEAAPVATAAPTAVA